MGIKKSDLIRFTNPDMINSYREFNDLGYQIIDAGFNNFNDGELTYIAEYLHFQMKKNNKNKILFNLSGEGLPFMSLDAIHRIIVPHLQKNYSMTMEDLILCIGLQPVLENAEWYLKYCKKFNWGIIKNTIFSGGWDSTNTDFKTLRVLKSIKYYPTINDKKFLCVNRNPRPHRLSLLAHVIKNDLLKNSYFSLFNFRNVEDELEGNRILLNDFDPDNSQWIYQILKDNINLLPLRINNTEETVNLWNRNDLPFLNKVCFIVTTETTFYRDVTSKSNASLDSFFLTEKTLKTVCSKRPFLLMTRPHTLPILRKMGYQTFHPFIDETYDTIDDDIKRQQKIIEEVKRLCLLSNQEWKDLQKEILPIVRHNFLWCLERKNVPKYLKDIEGINLNNN